MMKRLSADFYCMECVLLELYVPEIAGLLHLRAQQSIGYHSD